MSSNVYAMTIKATIASFFRHIFRVVVFNVLVILVLLGVLFFFPREYRSEAKLWIKIGRENTTIDPTATTGKTVSVQ
ncbi:MAG: hypothetical protein AAF483_29505, partial [Planctomycetota bacterium]